MKHTASALLAATVAAGLATGAASASVTTKPSGRSMESSSSEPLMLVMVADACWPMQSSTASTAALSSCSPALRYVCLFALVIFLHLL